MMARPPVLRTRCISFMAAMGCEKFLNAARHTMASKASREKRIAAALPTRKSTLTDSCRAFSAASSTKVLLISSPITWYRPRFASSIDRYPGPDATSRMRLPPGISLAKRSASERNSAMSLDVFFAYHVANPSLHPDALISLVRLRWHDRTSLLFLFSFWSSLRVPFLPFRKESATISLNALDQVLNEAELGFQSTKPVLTFDGKQRRELHCFRLSEAGLELVDVLPQKLDTSFEHVDRLLGRKRRQQ